MSKIDDFVLTHDNQLSNYNILDNQLMDMPVSTSLFPIKKRCVIKSNFLLISQDWWFLPHPMHQNIQMSRPAPCINNQICQVLTPLFSYSLYHLLSDLYAKYSNKTCVTSTLFFKPSPCYIDIECRWQANIFQFFQKKKKKKNQFFIPIFGFSLKNALKWGKWVHTSLVFVQWFLKKLKVSTFPNINLCPACETLTISALRIRNINWFHSISIVS